MKIAHRKCRWAFTQQWIYLFCLKWVDNGRDECREWGERSWVQQAEWSAATSWGSGDSPWQWCLPRASHFQKLLKVNNSQHFGPAYQISYWSVFNIKPLLWTTVNHFAILATRCQNRLECLSKSPHMIWAKLSPACIQSLLCCSCRQGVCDLYQVEYFDCRHFVWYYAVVFHLFIRSLSLCGFSQVIL